MSEETVDDSDNNHHDENDRETELETAIKQATPSKHRDNNLPDESLEGRKHVREVGSASSYESGTVGDCLPNSLPSTNSPDEYLEGRKHFREVVSASNYESGTVVDGLPNSLPSTNLPDESLEERKHFRKVVSASNHESGTVVDGLPNSLPSTDSRTSQTHINSLNVKTVEDSQDVDLGLSGSRESLSSAKETSGSENDSESNDNSENVSIDLSQHWERTQSEQDYESIATCRICHCDNEAEPLISPCNCIGTVKHVHHSCLMDWLKRCVKTKCELCLQPISVDRKTKPLKQWQRPGQKPTPIIWLLTFVVALTLNIASIAKDGSQKCISNPCIIFYVVGAIGALLGFAFFYHFLIVSIRYVKQWMALNEEWTLAGLNKPSGLGNENLALSDKSLGVKEQRELPMVEVV